MLSNLPRKYTYGETKRDNGEPSKKTHDWVRDRYGFCRRCQVRCRSIWNIECLHPSRARARSVLSLFGLCWRNASVFFCCRGRVFVPRQDEFLLVSVPLDTWVGRFVRITTPKHNGVTGFVYSTGNGWVMLKTALGDLAKRAEALVVIPESRADTSGIVRFLREGDKPLGETPSGRRKGEL